MIFTDKKGLVHDVQLLNLKCNRECKVVESKGNSWVAECKHDCNWRVQISPEFPLATIIEVVKKKFHFTISYKKVWLARTNAVTMVFRDSDESYLRLPRSMDALQAFNPGTVVMWDMVPKLLSSSFRTEMYMNCVFWAFKLAIEGFKYCRPMICIDDTHLYRKYKGKIVAATTVTVADKITPLAFAIVDKEMIESWGWFITLLRRHVCRDQEGVTLIFDRHRALLSVMSRICDSPAV
ncbi:uncharacterized protein LOC114319447 [Camellia sinensis]|uniref:uncharacterized protein LOC114319447 n=1 Tax=Camellia sinensis TaxID=4442 RepID=UPI0010360466|nr:uncharacterized protein LOC114319447 [Camellia sinensis]